MTFFVIGFPFTEFFRRDLTPRGRCRLLLQVLASGLFALTGRLPRPCSSCIRRPGLHNLSHCRSVIRMAGRIQLIPDLSPGIIHAAVLAPVIYYPSVTQFTSFHTSTSSPHHNPVSFPLYLLFLSLTRLSRAEVFFRPLLSDSLILCIMNPLKRKGRKLHYGTFNDSRTLPLCTESS